MKHNVVRLGLVLVLAGCALGLVPPLLDRDTHAQAIPVGGVRAVHTLTDLGPEDHLTDLSRNYDGSRIGRSSIKGSESPGADLILSAPATPGFDHFSYIALVANQLVMPISTPTAPGTVTVTSTPSLTPTQTATPTITSTPSLTPTQTATPTITSTPSLTPTQTATPTVTSTPTLTATGDVVIGDILFDASDEFVRIDNGGIIPQDMTDWRVESYANAEGICLPSDQVYTFTVGYVLDAGSSVRIHSGPAATDDPPDDPKWTGSYIWANPGDVAILYDSMGLVADTHCYGECCPLAVRFGRESR